MQDVDLRAPSQRASRWAQIGFRLSSKRMVPGELPIPLSDPPTGGQLGPTQASASWEASAWVADL